MQKQNDYVEVKLSEIKIGRMNNPRENFTGEKFDQFIESIQQHGVLQPILLRKLESGDLILVAGERRVRASTEIAMANGGIKDATIPAIVKELTDDEAFDAMMAENLHRENLTDLEEAKAFQRVLKKKGAAGITQLAERNCLSEGYIRKRIRILELPKDVLDKWNKGKYTFAHLEQFIRIENPEEREVLISAVDDWGYSATKIANMIDSKAMNFKNARFKTDACVQCFDNSKRQKTLFDLNIDGNDKCLKPACFMDKQKEYFTNNFKRLAVYRKTGTNGFKFYEDIQHSDHETFYNIKDIFPECKACADYQTVFWRNGTVCDEMVCLKPKCRSAKNKALAAGKKTKNISTAKQIPGQPRVEWHGQHFREEFYEKALPKAIGSVKSSDTSALCLTAFSLLKSNHELPLWFFENYVARNGVSKVKYFTNVDAEMFAVIEKMDSRQLKTLLKNAALDVIMQEHFFPTGRQIVADYLKIDLKKEWRLTEN
jgi:ParB/RepB/Spo0J family partition protein